MESKKRQRGRFKMTLFRYLIGCPAIAFLVASPALATTDESILGNYTYADQSFSISFDWQLDTIHGLRIRGQRYDQDIELIPKGLSSAFYSYDATLPKNPHSDRVSVLHLDAMFNSEDKAILVTGIYVELMPDKSGVERISYSKLFTLRRVDGPSIHPNASDKDQGAGSQQLRAKGSSR